MATTKEEWGVVLGVCYTDPLTNPGRDLTDRVYFALTHSGAFMSLPGATQNSHPLVGAIVESIQNASAATVTDVTNLLSGSSAADYAAKATELDPLVQALLEAGE